jgi:opacity protein-like surface antigen
MMPALNKLLGTRGSQARPDLYKTKDFNMRSLKLALLATAATAVLSSAAFAADLIVDTPPATPVVNSSSFNWDGPYIGALLQGQMAPAAFGIGADLGVNALMDNIVIGGEIEGVVGIPANANVQGTVKIGGLISDSALLYAYTGIGTRTPSSWYVPLGAGVEFAVADNVGLKVEGQYNFDLTSSAQNSAAVKVGINWHF